MKSKAGGRLLAAAGFFFVLALQVLAQSTSLEVVGASVAPDKFTNQPVLTIEISKESSQAFAAFTRSHVSRKMELRVDGKVLSAPVIREPILGTKLQISGNGTAADFAGIAKRLLSGGTVEVVIVPE